MINRNNPAVGRFGFAPTPLHFEFSVPVTVGGCQRRLQKMVIQRNGLLFGGKLDVDCVPLDEHTLRVHVLKHVGFNFEVQIDARLVRIAGNATFIQGTASIASSSYLFLGPYMATYCVVFGLMPVVLLGGSMIWTVPGLFVILHCACLVSAALHTVSSRNELLKKFVLTLRY